jgi:hypothetical protein
MEHSLLQYFFFRCMGYGKPHSKLPSCSLFYMEITVIFLQNTSVSCIRHLTTYGYIKLSKTSFFYKNPTYHTGDKRDENNVSMDRIMKIAQKLRTMMCVQSKPACYR